MVEQNSQQQQQPVGCFNHKEEDEDKDDDDKNNIRFIAALQFQKHNSPYGNIPQNHKNN